MIKQESRLTLRTRQELNCQQVIVNEATLLALPLGSGKTTVTVEALLREGSKVNLVVAPRNTAHGWERTVRRQYEDYTDPLLFRRIDSTVSGKKAMSDLWAGVPGWYFVTWQWFALRPAGFWDRLKVDAVIADECQRMQNRKSKSWRNMRGLGKNSRRIALSGTPQGNRMEGLWTTLRWLFPAGPKSSSLYRTPLSFWAWASDWLIIDENEFLGFTEVKGERFESGTMLSYYESYIREADPTEVPPVNDIIIHVPLSAEQRRLYRQVEKEAIAWLNTPDPETGKLPMVAELPMTIRLRLRQITLGVPIINENGKVGYAVDTNSSKIDAALEELELLDDNEPVLVFTHSREFAEVAAARFSRAGFRSFGWHGGSSDKARRAAVAAWGDPLGVQVIVAVVEAIAEGTDGLQDYCSEEIWLSRSENRYMNEQAEGRLPRTGQKRIVNRRQIIAPGTYDEGILDKHLMDRLESNASLRAGR